MWTITAARLCSVWHSFSDPLAHSFLLLHWMTVFEEVCLLWCPAVVSVGVHGHQVYLDLPPWTSIILEFVRSFSFCSVVGFVSSNFLVVSSGLLPSRTLSAPDGFLVCGTVFNSVGHNCGRGPVRSSFRQGSSMVSLTPSCQYLPSNCLGRLPLSKPSASACAMTSIVDFMHEEVGSSSGLGTSAAVNPGKYLDF